MGRVVNKSFKKVQKDIAKRALKLEEYLKNNHGNLYDEYSVKQRKIYNKISALCIRLLEEIDNLDEVEGGPE
jgi:hypothetical protein